MGQLLKEYKEDIDRPLSAILTLNTIAHTAGAIGVGAQAGKIFGKNEFDLGLFALSYEGVIAGLMTLAILVLSEIIPKTIGANMWRKLAPFTVSSIRLLLIVLAPFVWMSQSITRRLKREKGKSVFNRADFAALTSVGVESGAIDHSESKIIQNLLRLEQLRVKDIMTPRTMMIVAEENTSLGEFFEKHKNLQFSRIPTYTGKTDLITGMFLKDDLLRQLAEDKHDKTLKDIRREVLHVRDTDRLSHLLDTLVVQRRHIGIVMDEYGTVAGLVTMEDLFETILGLEIVDESDQIENLQNYARRQWEVRAKRLGLLREPPEEAVEPEPESPAPEEKE